MTNLEQVEKLCTMANISYEEAKLALDATNGDLLEAIILLEKQGKVKTPIGDSYFKNEKTHYHNGHHHHYRHHHCHHGNHFSSGLKKIGQFCTKMIRKGSTNSFAVLKGEEIKGSFPVLVLGLLLIFAFWVTLPLIIIGLFFGLRYRFIGPEFDNNKVNEAMNSVADAAENFKKSVNI
ncbi:UBA/TS-N domain protein [Desulfosporosinus sp. OT]|uniref:UBA/TS-N domain protein n=1 Tax=Desulfosporosinus sp. OT TaxID=913865 RepID=UPI000223B251|nr:UBA/TS-N domain protein [Desulfosporosinus sp. OT]EGW38817.1 UBA/TS-N domain protein [Desulfosporosinus sp. OT]